MDLNMKYYFDLMTRPNRAPAPVFLATTIVIFFLSLSAADSVGFVPCSLDGTCESGNVALSNLPTLGDEQEESREQQTANNEVAVLPDRIVIQEIGLDLPVQNPQTRDIVALDEYLKDGPVRYMDSAQLGESGNVLIFAHTSHLPVVKNQMYKAFNRIPELKAGDSITVQGDGKTYLYTVRSVRQADADEETISLAPSLGRKLTLVTCDTLTSKSSRFVLEADFVAVL